jgi:hypothetical protein
VKITIQLTDAQYAALSAAAEWHHVPARELAAAAVRDLIAYPGDDDLACVADRVLGRSR